MDEHDPVERWHAGPGRDRPRGRGRGRDPATSPSSRSRRPFPAEAIEPVLAAGQRVFGENYVQEAQGEVAGPAGALSRRRAPSRSARCNRTRPRTRWRSSTRSTPSTGPRSPRRWRRRSPRPGRRPRLLVQVNTGEEPQKGGVLPADADAFLAACRERYGLPSRASCASRRSRIRPRRISRCCTRSRERNGLAPPLHGHERRFRGRDPARRDPCAGRQRDLRGAAGGQPERARPLGTAHGWDDASPRASPDDLDPRPRPDPLQQPPDHRAGPPRRSPRSASKPGRARWRKMALPRPRHDRAAVPGDVDDQVVEVVVAPHRLVARRAGERDGAVVAAVPRVVAPAVRAAGSAGAAGRSAGADRGRRGRRPGAGESGRPARRRRPRASRGRCRTARARRAGPGCRPRAGPGGGRAGEG